MNRPSSEPKVRVNVLIPVAMKIALEKAIARRSAIAKSAGQLPATTLSGWLREKAQQTIAEFK